MGSAKCLRSTQLLAGSRRDAVSDCHKFVGTAVQAEEFGYRNWRDSEGNWGRSPFSGIRTYRILADERCTRIGEHPAQSASLRRSTVGGRLRHRLLKLGLP